MNHGINQIVMPDILWGEIERTSDHPEAHIFIINILSKEYFEDCHIKDSINIEAKILGDYVDDWDRNRHIVLYEAGDETPLIEEAYHILINMGFSDVRKLQGGMFEWLERGFPSEGACKMKYLPIKQVEVY